MSGQVYVNGRWLNQSLTGVQRYATEICRRLVSRWGDQICLVLPRGVDAPDWASGARIIVGKTTGLVFEQIELPLIARRGRLLAMSGPFSVAAKRQTAVMHDAVVFRCPGENTLPFRTWYRFLYGTAARFLQNRITVSHFSARELAECSSMKPSDFIVAWNSADHVRDINPVSPTLRLPEKYVVILGSTLAPRKNIVSTVRAFEAQGVPLVVIGSSPSGRVFRSTDSGTGQGAIYIGRVSDAEMAWVVSNAQALIFPSFYEGFGIPVIEAQVLGCPVIASRTSSIPEVAGGGALFFDPNEPNEAVALAAGILASADTRQRVVLAGYENASRFRWSASAEIVGRAVGLDERRPDGSTFGPGPDSGHTAGPAEHSGSVTVRRGLEGVAESTWRPVVGHGVRAPSGFTRRAVLAIAAVRSASGAAFEHVFRLSRSLMTEESLFRSSLQSDD